MSDNRRSMALIAQLWPTRHDQRRQGGFAHADGHLAAAARAAAAADCSAVCAASASGAISHRYRADPRRSSTSSSRLHARKTTTPRSSVSLRRTSELSASLLSVGRVGLHAWSSARRLCSGCSFVIVEGSIDRLCVSRHESDGAMAAPHVQPVRASTVRATIPPPHGSAAPATVYVQQSTTVVHPKVRCYCVRRTCALQI